MARLRLFPAKIRLRHVVGLTVVALPTACAYVAYKYRPRDSLAVEYHEKLNGGDDAPKNAVERWLQRVGGSAMVVLIGFLSRSIMHYIHQVDLVDDHKLHELIRSDRDGRPLVTYMTHASMLDEPLVMACLVPYDIMMDRRRLRWGICTEDVCFSRPHHAALFGSIKAIPVQRGGSIHQKGIASLQAKVNNGDWVHVFAEGRIWQENGDPLRDAEGRWCSASGRCGPPWQKVGPFKWGVGKVIANAAQLPVVVPIFTVGSNDILPQSETNDLLPEGPVLNSSKLVTAWVGDPVDVSDLIRDYHAAALQRAIQRNVAREAALQAALASAAAAATAHGDAATPERQPWLSPVTSRWLSWLLWGSSTAATAAPGSAAPHPPAPQRTYREPRNTDDASVDHSGASARIAHLPKPPASPPAPAATAAPGSGAEALARDLGAQAAKALVDASDAGEAMAKGFGDAARRAVGELGDSLSELAAEAEAKARELRGRMAELERHLREQWGDAAPPPKSPPLPGAPDATPTSTPLLPSASPGVPADADPAAAPLAARVFHQSISVPQPLPLQLPAPAAPGAATAAPQAAPPDSAAATARRGGADEPAPPAAATPDAAAGPRRVRAAPAAGAVPLSSAPVVEVVPTRTLRTGVVVPAYVEAPLRVKPPDHEFLTLAEAQAEEVLRLQLYADIAERLMGAMAELEAKTMRRRAAQGWVESRAMR